MTWVQRMQQWWSPVKPSAAATRAIRSTETTQRDLDEQRLLQDVWQRLERIGQHYVEHQAIKKAIPIDDDD